MNTPIERLHTALETLGLQAVEARLENLVEQASKREPSYADFLDELLSCEIEARRTRYLRARLQLAHLPFVKTFEQFDFGFQPSIDERQIRELRSLRFIHEASNVIFLGPPGVGKTHLSVALAEAAIRSGLGAYFITAHDLAADLGRAYREGRLDRRMRIYLAPKVLVIDEVGYLPLDDLGTTIFFQLFFDAAEGSPTDGLLRDDVEPDFHLVEPGRVGRREVHVVTGACCQPALDARMLVGSVVINDQMHVESFRDTGVYMA